MESRLRSGMDIPQDRATQVRRRAKAWTLWWADRNERWDRYWDMDPTPDVDELLREIDEDPTGIFWG